MVRAVKFALVRRVRVDRSSSAPIPLDCSSDTHYALEDSTANEGGSRRVH